MNTNLRRIAPGVSALFLAVAMLFSSMSVTAEDLLPPQMVIYETSNQLKNNVHKEELKSSFARATDFVRGVIAPHVDFDLISKRVLGKYWRTASEDQRLAFRTEFRELIVRTYTRAFLEYSDWDIAFEPLRMKPGDTSVVVKTEIDQPGARSLGVDYRMRLKDNEWKVYDVIIEGIGLVQNYRTSFKNEIASSGSITHLIAMLSEKNSEAMQQ